MIHVGFPRRPNGAFALLPDGRVTISNACIDKGEGTCDDLTGVAYPIQIWDPVANTIFTGPDTAVARLYHSTSIILPDGTVFAGGGGAPGPQLNVNGQVYYPGYLFNNDTTPATRSVIVDCSKDAQANTTIFIKVDNASNIERVTVTKNGHMTHAKNFDARWMELSFTVNAKNMLKVPLPNRNITNPGLWNMNVIDSRGVPSVASLMTVNMAYYCGSCQ
jgi:Domain of unknown function (DUF1929)